ncbi:hypothetical protein BaRGS_00029075, partial [Batillaria attramentaria]
EFVGLGVEGSGFDVGQYATGVSDESHSTVRTVTVKTVHRQHAWKRSRHDQGTQLPPTFSGVSRRHEISRETSDLFGEELRAGAGNIALCGCGGGLGVRAFTSQEPRSEVRDAEGLSGARSQWCRCVKPETERVRDFKEPQRRREQKRGETETDTHEEEERLILGEKARGEGLQQKEEERLLLGTLVQFTQTLADTVPVQFGP